MQKPERMDFAKLLGFETVSDQIAGSIDFQNQTMAARLGAKVGAENLVACDLMDSPPRNHTIPAAKRSCGGSDTQARG
jgi:hypothetical protein